MILAFISLGLAVLSRAVSANKKFIHERTVIGPLLFFGVVVGVTALLTGGIGLQSLGSNSYGGKGYFYLLAAIAGYFCPDEPVGAAALCHLYVGLFFLSGVTALMSNLAYISGSISCSTGFRRRLPWIRRWRKNAMGDTESSPVRI